MVKGIVVKGIVVGMMGLLLTGCMGRIETGSVGVRTEWNKSVGMEEVPVGTYGVLFSSVNEYVIKETELPLNNQRPKAKDNLTLADLDISVFYTVNPSLVAELTVKYANMSIIGEDHNRYPGYLLVERITRGTVYDVIAQHESLTLHTKRNDIENQILVQVQRDLNANDPGVFNITKVVIRQVVTDPALEASIQAAVMMEKMVEAKNNELALAVAEAARLKVEADGIAVAIKSIAKELTPEYVTYEQLKVMPAFAKEGTHTIVLPSGMQPLVNIK